MEAVMKSKRESEKDTRYEFDNSFDVPLPPAKAWPILTDIQRIAPCMPGVKLTKVVDKTTYQGNISVPLGPVALAFAGVMKFDELDPTNHTARVTAQGADDKGSGGAHATASFRVEPADGGSKVLVHTDLVLSGTKAPNGRGAGIVQAAATQIITQFAANLRAQVAKPPPAARRSPSKSAPKVKP
jgi:hypothetical protein